jgi:RimJ/RimL family protein N-acetyltransferase
MNSIEVFTERLRLRPVKDEDAGPTSTLMRAEIAANLTTWAPETTVAAAKERIDSSRRLLTKREALDLAILDQQSGSLIGWLSLFREGDRKQVARIGFWLGCDYQGQGLAVEAAERTMALGLDFLGVSELEACVYPWNTQCIRAIDKLRFNPDGTTELYSPVRKKTETAFLFRRGFSRSVERVGERHLGVDGRPVAD